MSFKQRYMDSLLSAGPDPGPELLSGRAVVGSWWRRFLASLLDVPAVGELSSHVALDAAPQTVTEGRADRQAPRTVVRAGSGLAQAPAPQARPVTVAAPKRGTAGGRVIVAGGLPPRPRGWAVAVAVAGLCLLAGLFALVNRQPSISVSQPPPTHSTVPTPSSTDSATDEPSMEPSMEPSSTPTGTHGQRLWQGTLTFPSQPGSNTDPVAAKPATELLADYALYLCAACSPQVIGGELLVPWNGTKPPTLDQCGSAVMTSRSGYVPLRVGQMGCFSSGDGLVGYITVLTTSPLSASAIIWSA
ncbi:hypothetical protein ABZT43_34015 [Streptomyces sp. NPDC005349]|uniref:hypothetical protein n=1 Tax=Streptomyces sp. NPDC005349 TaxID=3157037 RepID=UPI0033AED818